VKRTVKEDERGLYMSVGGWIIRPSLHGTNAHNGDRLEVRGGTDPTGRSFGQIVYLNGLRERWKIYNSEQARPFDTAGRDE
jgi:hypothetical protein